MFLALLALSLPALAWEPVFDAALAGSYWSSGLRLNLSPGLQQPLWNKPGDLLFADTFIRTDLAVAATPSYVRVGPRVLFAPIAVFNLELSALGSRYFGTFTSVVGFPEPDAVPDAAAMEAAVEAGQRGTAWQTRVGSLATLQGKVGPVVAVLLWDQAHWDTWPSEEVVGDYLFEPEASLIIARHDDTWGLSSLLLYQHRLGEWTARAGLYENHLRSMTTKDELLRLGPVVQLTEPEGRWSYLLLVQAHLVERSWEDPFPPFIAARAAYVWKPPPMP